MSTTATLCFVRHDPDAPGRSLAADVDRARDLASKPPCWVVLLGPNRAKRHDQLKKRLGLDGISQKGISAFAPESVCWETGAEDQALPLRLARYLVEDGLRQPLKRHDTLVVHLPPDMLPELQAAATEAAAMFPRVEVLLGDRNLGPFLPWAVRRYKVEVPDHEKAIEGLIGASSAMEGVRERVRRYAQLPYPVLIIGETGSGKELVAQGLHDNSPRKGRFLPVNAAGLPSALADSLLFGHVKGAFTDATSDRGGRIREAADGTFFLDEAFNLEPTVQAKLLRALNRVEEGVIEVEPVGSTKLPERINARLVVAAQRDPREERNVAGGTPMREDLYFRVAAGIIRVPPLRERLEDLPRLCRHLLSTIPGAVEPSDDAIAMLHEHRWPGNVRELRLVLLRALVDRPSRVGTLTGDVLRAALHTASVPGTNRRDVLNLPCNLEHELRKLEVETMRAARHKANDNNAEAGRMLGLGCDGRNFKRKLEKAEASLLRGTTGGAL